MSSWIRNRSNQELHHGDPPFRLNPSPQYTILTVHKRPPTGEQVYAQPPTGEHSYTQYVPSKEQTLTRPPLWSLDTKNPLPSL